MRFTLHADTHRYCEVYQTEDIMEYFRNDCSRLASYRRCARWALISAIRVFEPECVITLDIHASDARWFGELRSFRSVVG
eukprot:5319043-Heterocapsa_arctica.AAC.1